MKTAPIGTLLPQFASTAKLGKPRKQKREAFVLLTYATEHGPRIVLTPDIIAALGVAGIPAHRISNAVSDLRKYYGIPIIPQRDGRTVVAYTLQLPTPQSTPVVDAVMAQLREFIEDGVDNREEVACQ